MFLSYLWIFKDISQNMCEGNLRSINPHRPFSPHFCMYVSTCQLKSVPLPLIGVRWLIAGFCVLSYSTEHHGGRGRALKSCTRNRLQRYEIYPFVFAPLPSSWCVRKACWKWKNMKRAADRLLAVDNITRFLVTKRSTRFKEGSLSRFISHIIKMESGCLAIVSKIAKLLTKQ